MLGLGRGPAGVLPGELTYGSTALESPMEALLVRVIRRPARPNVRGRPRAWADYPDPGRLARLGGEVRTNDGIMLPPCTFE